MAVGEMHSPVRGREVKMVEQGRAAVVMPLAIKSFRATRDASRMFICIVESGSRAQITTCNA